MRENSLMDLNRKQQKGIIGIVAVLLGLLLVPPLLQKLYGINAIHTAFIVIVIYAGINYWMKKRS